jgi:glycosyltransferase involved in cell wall biosynthesis
VHVLYLIDSLARGGAEQSLASLAPHFSAAGVRLDVAYLTERDGVQKELTLGGAELFALGTGRHRLSSIDRVRRLLNERTPDLLHTALFESDISGRIAATITWRPVVSSLVNVAYGPEQLSDPRLAWWKLRGAQLVDAATATSVVRFHAVSRYVADLMSRRLWLSRARIDVVHRGRDASKLGTRDPARRLAARKSLGVTSTTPVLLAIARQEYQKGLDLLLRAMPRVLRDVPEARLFIAGRPGNLTDSLHQDIHRLDLADVVRFLGPREDVPDLLCGADVFVSPSRWEGMPGSLIEAMALETPIVASRIATIREAVGDDGIAHLVKPDDPDALAIEIVATLSDPMAVTERTRLGRTRFLERFTQEAIAAQMIEFYQHAVEQSRRRRRRIQS